MCKDNGRASLVHTFPSLSPQLSRTAPPEVSQCPPVYSDQSASHLPTGRAGSSVVMTTVLKVILSITHWIVGIETNAKVPQAGKQLRLHHPAH